MPKRLLIVTQHFWPENFRINDMVDGFLADGIVVDILCGMPNYPHGEWFAGYTGKAPLLEDYHGANLYRCREIPRKGNTSLRIFLNYISFPISAAFSLHKLPGDYDAVLCYNTSPVLMSFPAILAARKFKAPLTNYVLDIWPENLYSVLPIQNKALQLIAKSVSDWHYRQADRLIAMNDALKQRLIDRIGTKNAKKCLEPEKRYAVIPQYCEDFYDCEKTPSTAAEPCPIALTASQADAPFTLLFAGNFSPAQSLETALVALSMVKAQHTQDATSMRLVLVGDGMSRAALQAKANTLGLADWVQFCDSVAADHIPAYYAAADALLISLSDSADLGLTVPAKFASCMAAGKPLLVSMNGEGASVAQRSGAALVCNAADADALAQQMLTLLSLSQAARTQMGNAAHAYYKAHYSRTKLLQQIEEFLF